VALIERYNPVLAPHGIRLTALFKGQKGLALTRMGVADRVGSRKVDVLIEKRGSGRAPDTEGFGVVGGIHAKVSLAERVSDDIPASRIMMEEGMLSVLSTLDAHSDTSDQVFRRHMISHSGVSDHPEMTPSGAVW